MQPRPVIAGVDVLIDQERALIADRRIGLVGNASGVTRDLVRSVDALREVPGVDVVALFGPEHGFYAVAADATPVHDAVDAHTGLSIYSLYGDVRQPTTEMLRGIDTLVFDLQSVGVRFYTYVATLLKTMQAAAAFGVPVLVCDRPNPIGGDLVEGPVLQPEFESFLGLGPLPIRHGLTLGELARLFNTAWRVGCDLTVVPCRGWQRSMWFDQAGLAWVPPSPSMPKLETATVYPGTCLVEGTNLSEGRGTATPFEVVGAPWIDGWALTDALNELDLPGVRFRPTRFEPCFSKWTGAVCHGVHLHVRDRHVFRPVTAALHLIAAVKALYPEAFLWHEDHFDQLAGTDAVRCHLDRGVPVEDIVAGWQADLAAFEVQRQEVMLYQTTMDDGRRTTVG